MTVALCPSLDLDELIRYIVGKTRCNTNLQAMTGKSRPLVRRKESREWYTFTGVSKGESRCRKRLPNMALELCAETLGERSCERSRVGE